MTAPELLELHGGQIAQIIRAESVPLSDAESREILQSSISYYPTDLLVAGWTAALVYDTPEGAAPTIQLLEYANTQLLEYRHYDNLLTKVLETRLPVDAARQRVLFALENGSWGGTSEHNTS